MSSQSLLSPAIRNRWSPTSFLSKPIPPAELESLFEAARWAASCFNEQPWRFLIARAEQPEEFQRILKLLMPKNKAWAQTAPVLGLTFGKRTFTHNGTPDRFGLHDAGAALATLMIQAAEIGLHVHAMGGFDAAGARQEFQVPEDYEVGAAFAVGYAAAPGEPPVTRARRPLAEIAFSGGWERAAFGPE